MFVSKCQRNVLLQLDRVYSRLLYSIAPTVSLSNAESILSFPTAIMLARLANQNCVAIMAAHSQALFAKSHTDRERCKAKDAVGLKSQPIQWAILRRRKSLQHNARQLREPRRKLA